MSLEGPYFEIAELAWPREGEGSKVDRVQRLGPDFRGGHYHLPYETHAEWVRSGTETKRLTALQQRIVSLGHSYRVARPIRKQGPDGKLYDVSQKFREQVHFFPFAGKKDLVDAASRIYDMEPAAPAVITQDVLEPEVV
jgi:hypothetical protein